MFSSTQKFVRTSPRKLRPVVAMVKNMAPTQAVKVLPMIAKTAAEPLVKVIKSALANARMQEANEANLVFDSIQIGEGPRLKRGRAGSRGRLKPYKRRMSHIKVVLKTKEEKTGKKAEVKQDVEEKPVSEKKVEAKKTVRKAVKK